VHLYEVGKLWVADGDDAMDLSFDLGLLLVGVGAVVLAQPGLSLPVLQHDELDHLRPAVAGLRRRGGPAILGFRSFTARLQPRFGAKLSSGLCVDEHMAHALLHSLALGAVQRSVLITDGGSAGLKSRLTAGGLNVVEWHPTSAQLAAGCLAEHDAVIVRSATTLEACAIAAGAAGRLRVIGRAGVGVDNIAVGAARQHGCWVLNTAGASTDSVVELTLAHLLSAARRVPYADRQLRSGVWAKGKLGGHELRGKRLGLIGFGRISRGVAVAAGALGMEVHATSPSASPMKASALGVTLQPGLDELFSTCTHVSLHCGLNPQTAGAVGSRLLALMPSVAPDGTVCGSHLINLARGGIVDEAAAAAALRNGVLSTYSADVFETEPLPADSPLLTCDGFIGSPHVGGETAEAQERVGTQLAEAVLAALDGKPPGHGVVCAPMRGLVEP